MARMRFVSTGKVPRIHSVHKCIPCVVSQHLMDIDLPEAEGENYVDDTSPMNDMSSMSADDSMNVVDNNVNFAVRNVRLLFHMCIPPMRDSRNMHKN